MVKLETLTLDRYNNNYKYIKDSFDNISKSKYIHDVTRRLISSSDLDENLLLGAYIVLDNNKEVGYTYISSNKNDEVYLETSILEDKRNNGYGKKIVSEVSDYLFENKNIRIVKVAIDPSNINSIKMVESCDFIFDEDDYESNNYIGKMTFFKESTCYINKRMK